MTSSPALFITRSCILQIRLTGVQTKFNSFHLRMILVVRTNRIPQNRSAVISMNYPERIYRSAGSAQLCVNRSESLRLCHSVNIDFLKTTDHRCTSYNMRVTDYLS